MYYSKKCKYLTFTLPSVHSPSHFQNSSWSIRLSMDTYTSTRARARARAHTQTHTLTLLDPVQVQ